MENWEARYTVRYGKPMKWQHLAVEDIVVFDIRTHVVEADYLELSDET